MTPTVLVATVGAATVVCSTGFGLRGWLAHRTTRAQQARTDHRRHQHAVATVIREFQSRLDELLRELPLTARELGVLRLERYVDELDAEFRLRPAAAERLSRLRRHIDHLKANGVPRVLQPDPLRDPMLEALEAEQANRRVAVRCAAQYSAAYAARECLSDILQLAVPR